MKTSNIAALGCMLLCLSFFKLLGQVDDQNGPPKVIPPSPNASALAKFGNIPISTYTGVPEISIPLFEINSRDINVPVRLSYHASGIKVGEEASIVGLGWVLDCGGVITRQVMNADDFAESPYAYLVPITTSMDNYKGPQYTPKDFIVRGTVIPFYNMQGQSNVTENIDFSDFLLATVDYDFEPDQFSYNFLGYSGKFILDRNKQAIFSKQEKLRIRVLDAAATKWEATTPDGMKYLFEQFEENIDNTNGTKLIKSAWYLTKIISPKNETVTFSYVKEALRTIKSAGSFYEMVESSVSTCSSTSCPTPSEPVHSGSVRTYSSVFLDEITWGNGNGRIKFEMLDRLDVYGDKRLASVKMYDRNNQLKEEYKLNQDYFTSSIVGNVYGISDGDLTQERLTKRLKLVSISKNITGLDGSVQRFDHSFTYYDNTNALSMPSKNSFARDHWGYFNAKFSNTTLIPSFLYPTQPTSYLEALGAIGPERNPSPVNMVAFTLKDITYPTGGKTVFEYEAHQFEREPVTATGPLPQPVQIATPLFYPGTNKGTVFTQTLDLRNEYVSGDGSPLYTTVKGFFRTTGLCKDAAANPNVYFELYDSNGSRVSEVAFGLPVCSEPESTTCIYCGADKNGFEYTNSYILYPGIYTWKAFIGTSENEVPFQDISATYTWWSKYPEADTEDHTDNAGGLRIKKISDFDPVTNKTFNVREYVYDFYRDLDGNGTMEKHSYGKRMAPPVYSYYSIGKGSDPNGTGGEYTCALCLKKVMSSDSYLPLTGSAGSAVGYSKVIEKYGSGAQYGSIEYDFENEPDARKQYNYTLPDGSLVPLKPPVIATTPYEKNGMLTRKRIYKGSELVQKVEHVNTTTQDRLIVYGVDKRIIPGGNAGVGSVNVFLVLYESIHASFPYVSQTTETSYGQTTEAGNGLSTIDSLKTITEYYYEKPVHRQLTKKVLYESNKHKTITQYTYPADYTPAQSSPAISEMSGEKFMHNKPVEITVLDEDASGTQRVRQKEIFVYNNFGGLTSLQEKAQLKRTALLSSSSIPAYSPSAGYDLTKYEKVFALDYADGNVKTVQLRYNSPVAYLWGYQKSYPIAEIKNANAEACFHTSFEEDGVIAATPAKTGEKVLASGTYTFPTAYSPAANTVMSYWFFSNGKWSYSGEVPFTSTISSSGSYIDEVRAYPKGAQMTTFAYDPLKGVVNITDVNGVSSKYDYDSSNNLVLIRDNDGNIVKHFEYHYAFGN